MVLHSDDQPGLFFWIARSVMEDTDGFMGTFGNDHSSARLDIDRLPALVQLEAEGFLHNGLPVT